MVVVSILPFFAIEGIVNQATSPYFLKSIDMVVGVDQGVEDAVTVTEVVTMGTCGGGRFAPGAPKLITMTVDNGNVIVTVHSDFGCEMNVAASKNHLGNRVLGFMRVQ